MPKLGNFRQLFITSTSRYQSLLLYDHTTGKHPLLPHMGDVVPCIVLYIVPYHVVHCFMLLAGGVPTTCNPDHAAYIANTHTCRGEVRAGIYEGPLVDSRLVPFYANIETIAASTSKYIDYITYDYCLVSSSGSGKRGSEAPLSYPRVIPLNNTTVLILIAPTKASHTVDVLLKYYTGEAAVLCE